MKTSPSHRMVIVPFILLSRLFLCGSAFADACPAPSFAAAHTFDAGVSPFWVAVGDFNGDDKFDLAVANFHSADVSVLLGNGDGTFPPAINSGLGGSPVVADINGDGKLDLVTEGSVRLGNGDGTFKPAVNFSTGASPISVAVGDFNRDGKPDLAVANNGSGNVSVLLGNGDGTFQPAVNYGVA